MQFEIEWIRSLAQIVTDHELSELHLVDGERSIRLARESPKIVAAAAPGETALLASAPHAAAPGPAEVKVDDNHFEVTSPMVGTFYRSPSPEDPTFVEPGDEIAVDAVLCIIEAMKVMNEIKAEAPGVLVEVLVENGEAVEYGQPLFLLRRPS